MSCHRRAERIGATLIALLLFATAAQGAVAISGSVKDNAGTPIAGATVLVLNSASQQQVASTVTAADGAYAVAVEPGTYDVRVAPPPNNGFEPAVALNQAIAVNTVLNFVLVPAGVAALTGRVLDPLGGGLPNQTVQLAPSGTDNWIGQTTDALGNYSFQVAPGDYHLRLLGYNDAGAALNAPGYYYLSAASVLSLTASITMNISVPAMRVRVHVQDPQGLPVFNVTLTSNGSYNPTLMIGSLPATGESYYPSWLLPPATNASGDADLWLYPNGPYNTYTITAIPPSGSPWAVTNIHNVAFAGDTSITITLAAPVPLSGRVLDPLGSGLPNQTVQIAPWGTDNWIAQTTDVLGNYSFQTAPGDYQLRVLGYNDASAALNAPGYYYLSAASVLSLTASTTMDISVPAKRVRVHVQDSQGQPVSNVTLTSNGSYNPNLTIGGLAATGESYFPSWLLPPATSASGDAELWLYPNGPYNTYTITAIPPSGSPWAVTNIHNVAFAGDTSITITLATPVPLSGRVLDPLGGGLPNQNVQIAPWGTDNWIAQTTDALGNYSFQTAPGDYQLRVLGYNDAGAALNAPGYYYLSAASALSLAASTTMNISVPARRVRVHVQDPQGQPVSNVTLTSNGSYNPNLTIGGLAATGESYYPSWLLPPATSASGDADLWLYPNGPYNTYTFTATPPPGSPFVTFNVYDVAFTSDITVVVVLQYGTPPPPNACPVSQGFWKNHAEFWPVSSLALGGQTYTHEELNALLRAAAQGDASMILAYQLIAAKLNIAWGSDPDPIEDTLGSADSLLSGYSGKLPYSVKTSSTQGQNMGSAAAMLDQYNNMLLTPRCDALRPTLALTQAEREIERLRGEVRTLVQKKTLDKNQGRSLDSKLVGAKLNRENKERARLALMVFIREADGLARAGALSIRDANRLTDRARYLMSRLR